jgi:hypothetical protein
MYQTEPLDLVTFASVPGILAVVALLACYLPAQPEWSRWRRSAPSKA